MSRKDQRSPHRSIALLQDWWERQRAGRTMPCRAEFDPAAVRGVLPDLVMIDVAGGERAGAHRFTYRLAGTRVDERLGFALKGMTVDAALFGESAALIQQQYEAAVAKRQPVLCAHQLVMGGTRYVDYERLIVPLAGEDGETVVALAAAVNFTCAYRVEGGRSLVCRPVQPAREDPHLPAASDSQRR